MLLLVLLNELLVSGQLLFAGTPLGVIVIISVKLPSHQLLIHSEVRRGCALSVFAFVEPNRTRPRRALRIKTRTKLLDLLHYFFIISIALLELLKQLVEQILALIVASVLDFALETIGKVAKRRINAFPLFFISCLTHMI